MLIWSHTVALDVPKATFYQYATNRFADLPTRKGVKKAIKRGLLQLNAEVSPSNTFLKNGDIITLHEAEVQHDQLIDLPLEVVYEDDDIAVINKPAGLAVGGHHKRSIQRALYGNLSSSPHSDRVMPHAVHRLDKFTRGILLIAKTRTSQVHLGEQFQARTIKKEYHALCMGPLAKAGQIHIDIDGLTASTSWEVLEQVPDKYAEYLSLVVLKPHTGRRHQLRKHMACLGHAILGDDRYSPADKYLKKKGLFLAATRLMFNHPRSGDSMEISVPVPHKFNYRIEYAKNHL